LLDCRSVMDIDYARGIPNAEVIPLEELREYLGDLDKNIPMVVYCNVGHRSYIAYKILKHHGFNVRNLSGGYNLFIGSMPQ